MFKRTLSPSLHVLLAGGLLVAAAVGTAGSANAATSTTADCRLSGATGATKTTPFTPTGITADDGRDDTAGLQSAIDRAGAAGGGVVKIPRGTFTLNGHLVLRTGVKLQGRGSATVLKAGPGFLSHTGPRGGYPVITTNGARDVTVTNLVADQSGDVLNGNVDGRLSEYLVDVRGSVNAVVDGVRTRNPFTYSIVAADSKNFCITRSTTRSATNGRYDQLDGIHVLNSSFGDVTGNDVDQRRGTDGDDGLVAHTMNGSVHDVRYVGNRVRGGNHGSAMQLAYTSSNDRIYNLTIQRNEFWGSPLSLRTGIYGTSGSASNIIVGGAPGQGNDFHDNGGNAIDFAGNLSSIKVTHNRLCRSGSVRVGAGSGNQTFSNTGC
ncbi:glycosyl hydrolase family 28-related protein [Kineococcus sp. TBRC 1896]|uniref:Glycosyl hydrolase family 28-related protein n=1 Tax=Kineococcus mangrovi TaxID=1660183 RepID=A0ABV4HWX8_9ACTN